MSLETILKLGLNLFEFLAAFTGIFLWKKWESTEWKWFSIFLVFILLTEITGKLLILTGYKIYNPFLYRYLNIPVYIIFYLWILGFPFKNKGNASYINILFIIGYIIIFFVEELFSGYFKNFGTISWQFGSLGILILSIRYYITILKTDEILAYKTNMYFWVSIGLIFYLITTLPFNALRNILIKDYRYFATIYWYFTFLFNYIMYSFFILGFIWGKAK